MKTAEELKVLRNELETMNKKLAELNEEELAQVCGGSYEDYTFSRGDWIKSVCLRNTYPRGEELAYQVLAVTKEDKTVYLKVQQYIYFENECRTGPTISYVHANTCWHVEKPIWIT